MLMSLAAVIVVPVLLMLWSSAGRLRRSPWPAALAVLWFGFGLARNAAANIRAPREWDFACFWLYGHIAAAHLDIYDPAVFAHFPSPFTPSDEFRAAVLNVGFPYPPPSIALFWPLAFVHGASAALAAWYCVQFAALGGAAWLLARTFLPADGPRGALLVLALILALPAAGMTVGDAQTNFLFLLLVTLALAGQGTAAGAVWQTLAIWVKPYAAVLFVLDIIRGRVRRLAVAAATIIASMIAAVLLLGPATVTGYVRANPSAREPAAAFVEVVNQSLLAIVLRLHRGLPAHVSPLHEPLYLLGALILAGVTFGLVTRTRRSDEVAFVALLVLGLIVYPGSLSSYGVVLVLPFLVLWMHRDAFPGRAATVAAIVGLAVLLQSAAFQRGFEANVLVWLACAFLLIDQRGKAQAMPAAPLGVGRVQPVEAVR